MTEEESKLVEKLSEYGAVRTCKKVHDDVVMLIMTDDYSGNLMKSMKVMTIFGEAFPEHPIMETYISEENFCCIVLKKETNKNK